MNPVSDQEAILSFP